MNENVKEKITKKGGNNMKTLLKKLQECRVALQNKNLKKSGRNNFANFNYYELADFLPTINILFNEKGLFSAFSIKEEQATLQIIDVETGEEITFESPIAEANVKGTTPIQSLGAIHTYMKRYLYLNALEIVENDHLDGQVGKMEVEPKEEKKLTPNQKEIIMSLDMDKVGAITKKYGGGNIDNITMKQASSIIKQLKEKGLV
jgi:hypothetical protein